MTKPSGEEGSEVRFDPHYTLSGIERQLQARVHVLHEVRPVFLLTEVGQVSYLAGPTPEVE